MTPNVLLVLSACIPSRRWLGRNTERDDATIEFEDISPVPGTYRQVQGRWYLVANEEKQRLETPKEIIWSSPLRRWIFKEEFNARIMWARHPRSRDDKPVGFFRLDDGITYVNYLDSNAKVIRQHWQRFFIDEISGKLRPMVNSDCPVWRSSRSTPQSGQTTATLMDVSHQHEIDAKALSLELNRVKHKA